MEGSVLIVSGSLHRKSWVSQSERESPKSYVFGYSRGRRSQATKLLAKQTRSIFCESLLSFTCKQPLRVRRFVPHIAIRMHNVLENCIVYIGMRCSSDSLWMRLCSRTHCAFLWRALRSISSGERSVEDWELQISAPREKPASTDYHITCRLTLNDES